MSMSTESDDNGSYSGQLLTASSEVMVSAVIFFMVVLVFVFFLYLYAKNYWVPERERLSSSFVFFAAAASTEEDSPGLDATILESLPITIFQSTNFKEAAGGLECSVCLCEVTDGEEVRLLPKCKHGFHLECIDMWFHSHSTCPLCRTPITSPAAAAAAADPAAAAEEEEDQQQQLAANCLAGPSTSTKPRGGQLVIEIPIRPAGMMMDLAFPSPSSPLPTSKFPGDHEMKTPTSANSSWHQLRSLRRLLSSSRGKRAMASNSSCSTPIQSAPLDIEQGIIIPAINPLTPKTTPSN